ncbi:hypothetical protein BJG93_33805 (plasmid) [Paraburkholderia sprentiae WSM5005]|uniref:Uncharacterized protein n=1 Tax=Paraburkholderia sprentiae WSM5005 TaxID=754502 RepID=A0A1I9YWI5_9BURK|nr:hypothetical protein [Paraburkholderia sprentiae]APA90535.1 hypothetical protein BJG93_33805 [Paraburkholderia sprentiae WSM5005]
MNKTLKRIQGSMDASVLGATDPAVKYDQHSGIPRQFQDVHSVLLDRPTIDPSLTPQAGKSASRASQHPARPGSSNGNRSDLIQVLPCQLDPVHDL